MRQLIAALACASIATMTSHMPSAAKPLVNNDHWVIINCDHKDVGSEETKDEVFVEWFRDGKSLYKSSANISTTATSLRFNTTSVSRYSRDLTEGPPKCDSNQVAIYYFDGENDELNDDDEVVKYGKAPTHFTITTTGSDGFFMDWVEYKDRDNKERNRRFGRSQNNGYCLSTDASDATRTWKDHVQGCYKSLKFHVKTGRVTVDKGD